MFGINLGNLIVHLRTESSQYERGLKMAEHQLNGTARAMKAMGRSMSMYVTAPIAMLGGAGVKAFASFDQAMTESLAIQKGVSEQMKSQMRDTARTLSTETITSAQELAQSYYYLASAGMNAEQSVQALGAVNSFAVAGMFDMNQATTLLADAQAALGMKTDDAAQNMLNMTKVSDVLVKANTLANASVEQFSRALTNKAAASIKLLNKDLEEGVAVLAAYADQGIKGERAGEALNIVSRDLQRAAIKSTDAWKSMGISVYDSTGTMRSYADIIGDLTGLFSTMTDEQKKQTAEQLGFQARSFSYLQMLLGTSDKIRQFTEDLRDAGGMTKEVAEKQLKSFTNQMKILKNQIIDVAIGIGEVLSPHILALNERIKDAIKWWGGLSQQAKMTIVLVAAITAAIGPALIAFGFLTQGVAAVIAAFRLLTVVGWKWMIVIALVGTAVWAVVDAFAKADLGFHSFIEGIEIGGAHLGTWLKVVATAIWQSWDWAVNKMALGWEWLKTEVTNALGVVWRYYITMMSSVSSLFFGVLDKIVQKLIKFATFAVDIGKKTKLISQADADEAITVLEGIKGGWNAMVDGMDTSFQEAIDRSYSAAEQRTMDYYQKAAGLDEQYKAQAAVWEQVRNQLFADDASIASPGLGESFGKLGGAIMDLPGFRDLKKFLDEFFSSSAQSVEAATAAGKASGVGKAVADAGVGGVASGVGTGALERVEFQQIALNRMSLAGLAGAPPSRKQQVEAPGVNERLDTLIGLQTQSLNQGQPVLVD